MALAINLRARTRACEPRPARKDDVELSARARRAAEAQSATRANDDTDGDKIRALGQALRRLDVALLGAPWCEKCKQQKQLLAELLPTRWRQHYVDCGNASRCLTCARCATTPTWRVGGRRYPGVFDLNTLTELVGLQQIGHRQTIEDRVIDAVDAGDPLGGLKLGDLPVRGRSRRHRRRAGWAKRDAVRLAQREQGKFWCEFGELLTPRIARRAREAALRGEALRPV